MECTKAAGSFFQITSGYDVLGNMTVETWIKFPSGETDTDWTVFGKADNAGAGGGGARDFAARAVPIGSDTSWQFQMNDGTFDSSDYTQTGVQTLFDGSWHHAAWVYTAAAGTCEFFLDGVSVGTGSAGRTSIRSSTRSIYANNLGTDNVQTADPSVRMVMLRHWSVTRTALQLTTNWCTTLGATANLVSEWTFDNTPNDNSGNGHDFTAKNSPTYNSDVPSTCGSSGPANLKTLSTITKANLKTLNTITLANLKTLDTIT